MGAKMAHDSPAGGWVFSVMPLLQDQRSPFSVPCFISRWQSTILIHERVVIFCWFSLVGDLACSQTGRKPGLQFLFCLFDLDPGEQIFPDQLPC